MIDIKRINLETSLVCNTKCKFCPRTILYEKGIKLPKKFLDLNKFFALDFENTNIHEIIICGSFGEPTLHPEFFRLLKFFNFKKYDFILHTNGAVYSQDWWKRVARHTRKNDYVTFALEGIDEKTHRPYRQTSFKKVTENMKAFTRAGGNAIASMLVFEHNENCIEQYKKLAFDELGCKRVHIKSSRKYDNILKAPSIKLQNTARTCFPLDFGEVMVDVDSNIYPCCYMYNDQSIKPSKLFKELETDMIGNHKTCKSRGKQKSFIEKISYNDYIEQKIEKRRNQNNRSRLDDKV